MTKQERLRKRAETARAEAELERAQAELKLERHRRQVVEQVTGQAAGPSFRALTGPEHYKAIGAPGWSWSDGSADASYLYDLAELRAKSRQLCTGSAIAAGVVGTATTNVIGKGLRLQANVDRETIKRRLGWSDDYIDQWEERVEKLWSDFWNTTRCDYSRRLTGPSLERLAYRSMLVDGDCLVIFRGGVGNRSIQLVSASDVDNPAGSSITDTMRAGVEIDPTTGRVSRYYVNRSNSIHGPGEYVPVPAYGPKTGRQLAILLYRKEFIGQTRGIPFLAPIMHSLKALTDYADSEKVRAKVSSLISFFIKKRAAGFGRSPLDDLVTSANTGEKVYDLKPGSVVELDRDDEGIDFANPNAPNSNYANFVDASIREVGAGVQIPKSAITKENNASYSASKADRLEAFRFFLAERTEFIAHFHSEIYKNALTDFILLGEVEAPGFFEDEQLKNAFLGAQWEGETPGQIDPVKDTAAARLRNSSFYTTITTEAAAVGQDFSRNLRRARREKAMIEKAGLTVPDYMRGL